MEINKYASISNPDCSHLQARNSMTGAGNINAKEGVALFCCLLVWQLHDEWNHARYHISITGIQTILNILGGVSFFFSTSRFPPIIFLACEQAVIYAHEHLYPDQDAEDLVSFCPADGFRATVVKIPFMRTSTV